METFQLYYMKQAFAPIEKRFTRLHEEAVRLRYLWSYEKRFAKRQLDQELRNLYREAAGYIKANENLSVASGLIKKILKHDPRAYAVHALKGKIYELKEKWTDAIKSYEVARLMEKVVPNQPSRYAEEHEFRYVDSLINCYDIRGDSYYKRELYLHAANDYERALELKPLGIKTIEVQDKLLGLMRVLQKYEAFYTHWLYFVQASNPIRVSDLLTVHAEYKFFLRDVDSAREFLLEALDLNENNTRAQQLLQKMYDLGQTMTIHAIIWCMHRCYDKALYTIEKVRDCDPSSLQYILLKTIILRLSGRMKEAIVCLGQTRDALEKSIAPSRVVGTSIPLLTVQEIREQIRQQFLLARSNTEIQQQDRRTAMNERRRK